jgi:ABC-type dipeptide/oligopeptide/nickel transport system permease subunit
MNQLERLMYHVELRIFPVLILTICSFGGFALMALQGLRRVAQDQQKNPNGRNLGRPSFSECIVSVLPDMKLNIAFIMSCVIVIEPLWNLDGIGLRAQNGMLNSDMAIVEVCVFLVLLMVLVSGFILDMCSSLVAVHFRRARGSAGRIVGGEAPFGPYPSGEKSAKSLDLLGEVRWFVSEFRRSVPGVVGGVMLVAVAVLALIGSVVVDHPDSSLPYLEDADPLDQFLLGASDPFLYALAVLALSFVIGFSAGLLSLPLRKFNYPVVLVAEAFIIFPIVGLFFMILMLPYWSRFDDFFWRIVLSAVLVTWTPVALAILNRSKDIDNAYGLRSPRETGIARYRGLLTAGAKETIPDALASLKFVAVVSSLSILAIEYTASGAASWGGMIFRYMQFCLTRHDIEFNLWWILPLVGIVVMASGFYLVLQATQDILEKRVRPSREVTPSPPSGP